MSERVENQTGIRDSSKPDGSVTAGGNGRGMLKLAFRAACVGLTALVLYACVFLAAFCLLPPLYQDSYQSVVVRQYDSLKEIQEPKVIVLGTSYVTFSVDADLMEQKLGMPCQIFGCHLGMGTRYFFDMSEEWIGEGDIVVYPIWEADMNYYGTELILTGIEGRMDLLLSLPPGAVKGVLAGSRDIITKKLYEPLRRGLFPGERERADSGVDPIYTIDSFDEKGTMKALRQESWTEPVPEEQKKRYDTAAYSQEYIAFLNEFDAFCRERGAVFCLTYPTILDEAVENSEEELEAFDRWLREQVTAPVITDIRDTLMPKEEIYNGVMHCNTPGAEHYTSMLAEDIKREIFDKSYVSFEPDTAGASCSEGSYR